jgi:hypothetical protein
VFENWLGVENFDAGGRQKTSLSESMQQALAKLR